MVNSLLVFPKMLTKRPLAYENQDGRFVVLGGNYRLRGLNEIAGYTIEDIKERLQTLNGYKKKSKEEKEALLVFWDKWLGEPKAPSICLDDMTAEEKKEFIIKDNLSYGEWDEETLRNWNLDELEEWGLNKDELRPEKEEYKVNPYADAKLDNFIYEPKGDMPDIKDCVNLEKMDFVMEAIKNAKVTKEEKRVLEICAYRFAEIDFSKMAEYYCHASKEMQKAMETNFLVIIDANEARERGFIEMRKDLLSLIDREIAEDV